MAQSFIKIATEFKLAVGITVPESKNIVIVKNQGRKEGNVLFNDTLNTFYLRLYG